MQNVLADASLVKLQRSSPDGSMRPPTAGAAIISDARLLIATINAATLSTTEIETIAVVISTTIVMTTTPAPSTERQNTTIANARLAMGIAFVTMQQSAFRVEVLGWP